MHLTLALVPKENEYSYKPKTKSGEGVRVAVKVGMRLWLASGMIRV